LCHKERPPYDVHDDDDDVVDDEAVSMMVVMFLMIMVRMIKILMLQISSADRLDIEEKTLSRKTSVVKQLECDGLLPPNRFFLQYQDESPGSDRGTKGRRPSRSKGIPSVDQLEAAACKLEPKVEGRIMQLTPEVRRRLQGQKEAGLSRLTITVAGGGASPESPEDPARAALFGKPSKGKAIAVKNGKATKAQKGNESSDYESDSEDGSESEGSDIK
jgi:hypothetical protein